jgi:hypothetical protein
VCWYNGSFKAEIAFSKILIVVDFLLSQPNSSMPKRLEKSDRAEKKLIYPKKLFGPKLMG